MRRPRLKTPLRYAASENREAVILLTGRGAIFPPVETWRRARKSVYVAFRRGRIAQTGEEVLTYEHELRLREEDLEVLETIIM